MEHYETARSAAYTQRTGVPSAPSVTGDESHLHAIKQLLAGMDEGVDYSDPANKRTINNIAQGYQNIDKAVQKHRTGDHLGAVSYATLAAHHATEAGRGLSPDTEEEAQLNYDPYVIAAASGGANTHRDDFIKTVNKGK
jgi:hypothetical protein